MILKVLSIILIITKFGAGQGVTPSDTTPLQETTKVANVSVPPFITIQPSTKVKYSMSLTDTGPAVFDSTIHFTATLKPDVDHETDPWPREFSYQWMNMVDMTSEISDGFLTSSLNKTFSSDKNIKDGEYLMTVAAFFKDEPTKVAAFQTMKFILTEQLNGNLRMTQNLEYQRLPNVFRTNTPITLIADVRDDFQATQRSPLYLFSWFKVLNGKKHLIDKTTDEHTITTTIDEPANFTLTADVTVLILNLDAELELENNRRGILCDIENPNYKCGNFKETVFFKDALTNCQVQRADEAEDIGVEMGHPALVNISCTGSGPISVCVTVATNETVMDLSYDSCQPTDFIESLNHQVEISLNETGLNHVHVYIYNDVSRTHKVFTLKGYNADDKGESILLSPIIFTLLGLMVMITGFVYAVKLRKDSYRRLEVADFDFHPSLTSSVESQKSWLTESIRFLADRMPKMPKQPQRHEYENMNSTDIEE